MIRPTGGTSALAARALLLVLAGACAALPPIRGYPRPEPPSAIVANVEAEVHDRVNRYRDSRSLERLARDPVLDRIARDHSQRMAAGAYPFGHEGLEDRYARARLALGVATLSENVARYSHPPADVARAVADGWAASATHQRNLTGDFDLTGVGAARSAAGEYFVTQLYAVR